ncbi:MAG: hypothetical protein H0V52_07045, partial [Acidimicrobiia bacterium]|nr:hypothetical protein [Acidimicrobiia bacterium]
MTTGRVNGEEVTVEEVTEATPDVAAALSRLVPQLSRSSAVPTGAELAEMVASAATVVLVARDDGGEIVGTLTLALFRIPTGVRAW